MVEDMVAVAKELVAVAMEVILRTRMTTLELVTVDMDVVMDMVVVVEEEVAVAKELVEVAVEVILRTRMKVQMTTLEVHRFPTCINYLTIVCVCGRGGRVLLLAAREREVT